jgi:uncharacterized protein YggE
MTNAPIIAVRGEVNREVDPEIAEFHVGVSAQERDRPTTLTRLSERVAAVRAALEPYADALERQETSRLSVRPLTKRAGEKVVGYAGYAATSVVVSDLDRVGEIMLRVADLERVTVDGPHWSLRPGSPVYRQAREAANGEALTRAREYAHALGARVTGLTELTDSGMSGGGAAPRMMRAASLGRSEGAVPELDLDPQVQRVYANVEARFTISAPTVVTDPID